MKKRPTWGIPLSKSAWKTGRLFMRWHRRWQDYWRNIAKSAKLFKAGKVNTVVLLTAIRPAGDRSELEYMQDAARSENLPAEHVVAISECVCTYTQVVYLLQQAKVVNANLHFISSNFHYPRVRWIAWRLRKKLGAQDVQVSHSWTIGIPRPAELVSDIILMILYPIIDLLGGAEWFVRKTEKRVHLRSAFGRRGKGDL